jgi:hypothetical protein
MIQGRSSSFIGWPRELFVDLRREDRAVIVGNGGVEKQLPLDQRRKFSVFEREKIMLAIGDRIRFTKNVKHRGQKFLNSELRTVSALMMARSCVFDRHKPLHAESPTPS